MTRSEASARPSRRFEARNPADYLVALGDNDYTENPGGVSRQLGDELRLVAPWPESGVAGVLGNHDVRVQDGRYEFDELKMPARYYRRAIGPVELYLLDSNDVDDAQTAWLQRTLARSRARWKIAVFHHPAFTCGNYHSHDPVVERWVPLFERYRVRLVLSGHDHNYQRFAPRRGVRYVVHGGGRPGPLRAEVVPVGLSAPDGGAAGARVPVPRDPRQDSSPAGR